MDIAIIGLACRMPGGASSSDKLWQLLLDGTAVEPKDRFNVDGFHYAKKDSRLNTILPRKAHFMQEDVGAFDAHFFGMSQNEAKAVDPQQRMLLEVVYEAFENAGLSTDKVAGTKMSCYVGVSNRDYFQMLCRDPDGAPLYTLAGTADEIISNRVSWFYDLRGPSITIETACSASLVALHQACQSIRTGESSTAVVGGVNLLLNAEMFQFLSNQGFLAPDGICKAFDASANGYGRGEGILAVVLKPADDAIRDGDPIRAIIRGTGVNQDGKTPGGITVPNSEAQKLLIKSTYESAGLEFSDTNYFEAHGPGTRAGDPRELRAIAETISRDRPADRPLHVGSIKTNVGHLEAASGLAGLVKSIFILENGIIPASLHLKEPNPDIPFQQWKLTVPTKNTPWPTQGLRRVSLNSFGFGGTNAHVIIDDAQSYLKERLSASPRTALQSSAQRLVNGGPHVENKWLFVFSASDAEALSQLQKRLLEYIDKQDFEKNLGSIEPELSKNTFLRNLAFSLNAKRSRFSWRTSSVASSLSELSSRLDTGLQVRRSKPDARIGFVFTGQGAQWAKMGLELMAYPIFRESIEEADIYLRAELSCKWSLIQELQRDEVSSKLENPAYSQIACTVLQVALVDLLSDWNIRPVSVVGHSSGEIAAAYCLGVISRMDAWKVAFYRGQLSSELQSTHKSSRGAMLAVGASEQEAESHLSLVSKDKVVLACINSPQSVTLSGDASSIDELAILLTEQKIFNRKLRVETAYHSPQMDLISRPYFDTIADVEIQTAVSSIQMFSSVTGALADPDELGPANWVRNLVSPVRFNEALQGLLQNSDTSKMSQKSTIDILVEIGPHSALQGPSQQILESLNLDGIAYESALRRKKNGVETALELAGRLFALGAPVDLARVNSSSNYAFDSGPKFLSDLPSYPWNHSKSFWAETRTTKQYRKRATAHTRLLGAPNPAQSAADHIWRNFMRVPEERWLRDHQIQGSLIFPAAGFLAIAVEGAKQIFSRQRPSRFIIRDSQMRSAVIVTHDAEVELVLQIRRKLVGTKDTTVSPWFDFCISSSTDGRDLIENCTGMIKVELDAGSGSHIGQEKKLYNEAMRSQFDAVEATCKEAEDANDFYKMLRGRGFEFGPTFLNLKSLKRGRGQRCFTAEIPDTDSIDHYHDVVHPTMLDSIFQSWNPPDEDPNIIPGQTLIPRSFDEITISADIPSAPGQFMKGWSMWKKDGFRDFVADIGVVDTKSNTGLMKISGMHLTPLEVSSTNRPKSRDSSTLCSKVQWIPFAAAGPGEDTAHSEVSNTKEGTQGRMWGLDDHHLKPSNVELINIIEPAGRNTFAQELANHLETTLIQQDVSVQRYRWGSESPTWQKGAAYITLLDLNDAFITTLPEKDWQTLKDLLLSASNVLWLVKGDSPDSGTVSGLARVVRNEHAALTFRTLRITSQHIAESVSTLISKPSLSKTQDNEFVEVDGSLHVSRLVPSDNLNDRIANKEQVNGDRVTLRAFPMDMTIRTVGNLGTLCFEPKKHTEKALAKDEVEIDVKATGLNFRDVMAALGQIPDQTIGFEASGVVRKVGSAVSRFRAGDAVCAMGPGAQTTRFRANELLCQHMPKSMSFEEAATVSVVHCVAYHALVRLARVQKTKSILIHAAAGGIGQAAVQLSKALELDVFVTVGSSDKKQLIAELYDIPHDRILSSRDLSFGTGIMRLTQGRGVDYILNCLSGEALTASWNCLGPFGTFVEIGLRNILGNAGLEMRPFLQGTTCCSLNLSYLAKEQPQILGETMDMAFDLLRRGTTRPVKPLHVFPVSEAEEAFRLMQSGEKGGKYSLALDPDDMVQVTHKPAPKLRNDSTYLVAGGFGGLGRSLCEYLVNLNAKHICLLSRTGASSEESQKLLQSLTDQGVDVRTYSCDIADKDTLRGALDQCSREMPPIKGVFQCAMILRDVLYEKMTYQDWADSLRPKVQGTWNLHELLPQDPEMIFIMLSTFAGIFGNHGQVNYAAGSTYQDQFAYYRRAHGLKSVSIDLGSMRDVGVLAEKGAKGYLKLWNPYFGIRETEFHALVREILAEQLDDSSAMKGEAQIVTGFATGGAAKAAGIQTPFYFDDERFSVLRDIGIEKQPNGDNHGLLVNGDAPNGSPEDQVQKLASDGSTNETIGDSLVARVASALQMPVNEVEKEASLIEHGVDSLVAVELRNWLIKAFGVELTILELLSNMPITELAFIIEKAVNSSGKRA